MSIFNNSVLKIIKDFSYPFYIVQQNFDVKCVCINYDTHQADPNCKKCLGTGYKIKIKKIKGASQETGAPATMRETSAFIITRNYYISSDYPVEKDNIIVDNDDVYYVYQNQKKTSFEGELVYQKAMCQIKKLDSDVFLKNFDEIVGR